MIGNMPTDISPSEKAKVALPFLLATVGLCWIPAVVLFTLGEKRLKRSIEEEHSLRLELAEKLLRASPPA